MLVGALAVFLVYALNFFNFFVDDEGIPLVYAHNLIRGRGLTYTAIEGRIEGYSDFLHVLIDAVLLLVVKALHWRRISIFFVGDTFALAAGLGTVGVVFATLRRSPAVAAPGAVAGLAFLALSGPLAVWSCSSLETAPFTFFLSLVMFGLVGGTHAADSRWFDRLVVGAGVAAILDRLDGPVYAGTLIAAFLALATASRRRQMYRRIIVPLAAATVLYQGWRIWYFEDLLNMPLYAKVMYKFTLNGNIVTKATRQPYWLEFVGVYGWPAVLLAIAAAAHAAWRERSARPLLIALAMSALYVSFVGDWMFGFRFFAHLMPMAAVTMAVAISVIGRERPRMAWPAALTVVIWCTTSATAFERRYEAVEEKPSWWRSRALDERALFGSYYSIYEAARDRIGSGVKVSYNQAGFLPFMLELENIDTLGICSRFYAEMPTRDVFFTEVGRYSPLTDAHAINAAQAYLLYQDVPFLIERRDLLIKANAGRVPGTVMDGYYAITSDTASADVIYQRTDRDASEYTRNPRIFFENLAHVAYLRSANINGERIAPKAMVSRLPFLRQDIAHVALPHGRYTLDVTFADADVDVSELDVARIASDTHEVMTLDLRSADGSSRDVERIEVAGGVPREFVSRLASPVKVNRLVLQIDGDTTADASVWLTDMRVQGQSAALARYIRDRLSFAAVPKAP